jgi:hypothetical protein
MTVGSSWYPSLFRVSQVPIFSSPFADENVLSGCWSPTRPAVIAIALADGSVQMYAFFFRLAFNSQLRGH